MDKCIHAESSWRPSTASTSILPSIISAHVKWIGLPAEAEAFSDLAVESLFPSISLDTMTPAYRRVRIRAALFRVQSLITRGNRKKRVLQNNTAHIRFWPYREATGLQFNADSREDRATVLGPKMPAERYCPAPLLAPAILARTAAPLAHSIRIWIITGSQDQLRRADHRHPFVDPDEARHVRQNAHQAHAPLLAHASLPLYTTRSVASSNAEQVTEAEAALKKNEPRLTVA